MIYVKTWKTRSFCQLKPVILYGRKHKLTFFNVASSWGSSTHRTHSIFKLSPNLSMNEPQTCIISKTSAMATILKKHLSFPGISVLLHRSDPDLFDRIRKVIKYNNTLRWGVRLFAGHLR